MAAVQMEELTSGASGRIIPLFKNLRLSVLSYDSLRRSVLFVQSIFLWFLLLLPRRRLSSSSQPPSPSSSANSTSRRKFSVRREEEDTLKRRALAEGLQMVAETDDWASQCQWSTSLFFGVRRNALFCRSWFPIDGHGGSDGLHGYVPSLDHVVADTGAFLEKIRSENPGTPCFLFGHSTGGAIVLKAASFPHIEQMLEGIILTSPALRVKPAHPIVGAVAPLFSLVAPRYQFKGANKRGIPVSRDPAALLAKYSDPLVYTGPMRVRTGHEILRISSHLLRNLKSVTIPFFVLHGTADKVTDPLASRDLYNEAASRFKDIKLYEGFLHDLLFEPEREEVAQDIIGWMEMRLTAGNPGNVYGQR
ncbi:acylglycerol lipase [Sarracenia purpurea var. burkii]